MQGRRRAVLLGPSREWNPRLKWQIVRDHSNFGGPGLNKQSTDKASLSKTLRQIDTVARMCRENLAARTEAIQLSANGQPTARHGVRVQEGSSKELWVRGWLKRGIRHEKQWFTAET